MSYKTNETFQRVLAVPGFGFISAIKLDGRPVVTRLYGYSFDADRMVLKTTVFEKDAQRLIKFLDRSSQLAITASDSTNYQTIQFKGTYRCHRKASTAEIKIAKEFREQQQEIMGQFGLDVERFNSWSFLPALTIEIDITKLFEQSPKPNTGQKI